MRGWQKLSLLFGLNLAFWTGSAFAAPQQKPKTIYNAWFTVVRQDPGQTPQKYQFYNDALQLRDGKLYFQNHLWKKEEDTVAEEQIGATAEFTGSLTPLFFNFKSIFKSAETQIDGSFTNPVASASLPTNTPRPLSIKIRRNGSILTPIQVSVAPRVILSTFFSTWLSTQFKTWTVGQSRNFQAILENDLEGQFRSKSGTARLEPPDDLCRKYSARKILLQLDGQRSIWWVDAVGLPYQILFPDLYITVNRTTESQAKAFLD